MDTPLLCCYYHPPSTCLLYSQERLKKPITEVIAEVTKKPLDPLTKYIVLEACVNTTDEVCLTLFCSLFVLFRAVFAPC
jgi:hypothetical protein